MRKGSAVFYIENRFYTVKEGEAIFVNAKYLHSGTSIMEKGCLFDAALFHPTLLTQEEYGGIYTKYFQPVLSGSIFLPEHFTMEIEWQREILEKISVLFDYEPYITVQELSIISTLFSLWELLFAQAVMKRDSELTAGQRQFNLIRPTLEFIHSHYNENITLEELASRAALSQSYYNHIFKSAFGQSPISYVIRYRLNESCKLLSSSDMKITDIASRVGFSNVSYYNREFLKQNHCTPKQYRKEFRK